MYTPEQIRQCISWLAGNFRVTADGKYRECADILAATLKAAQGGVTEAGYVFVCSNPACRAVHIRDPRGFCPACVAENGSGWSTTRQRLYRDGPERYSTEEEGEAFMDGWYDGQAALSAQQGQGLTVYLRAEDLDDLEHKRPWTLGAVGEFAESRRGDFDTPVYLYTAPPAQPAERVPEESYRGVPYRVLGKAFQRALADPNVLWRAKYEVKCPKCGWTGFRAVFAKRCPKCQHWKPEPTTQDTRP